MSRIFDALSKSKEHASEAPALNLAASAAQQPLVELGRRGPVVRVARLDALSMVAPLVSSGVIAEKASDQYRIARTKIVHHPSRPKVIVISSAAARDGKTVTAINLAWMLALKPRGRVLLLDADFRRAGMAERLRLPCRPGLADVLRREVDVQEAILQIEQLPLFHVLPAGVTNTPTELLDSEAWHATITHLKRDFSYILIDSPPMHSVADYQLIEEAADGLVMVVRPDHTPRDLMLSALAATPKEKLIGVLLNAVPKSMLNRSGQESYYQLPTESGS